MVPCLEETERTEIMGKSVSLIDFKRIPNLARSQNQECLKSATPPQERLFFLHAALLVFAVLHLQPIARVLSARSWAYFMQTAIITHGYKVLRMLLQFICFHMA